MQIQFYPIQALSTNDTSPWRTVTAAEPGECITITTNCTQLQSVFFEGNSEKARETRGRALAKLVGQFAIIKKISANDFRDVEYILATRNREENVVPLMNVELNHLFAVT